MTEKKPRRSGIVTWRFKSGDMSMPLAEWDRRIGKFGGRPSSGKARPTAEQLAERLLDFWRSRKAQLLRAELRRRGIDQDRARRNVLACFVKDLAAEFYCDERAVRRWLDHSIFDLVRRR